MGVLFLIIFFIVSFFIVGLVLLQEGKGGGLTGMSAGMDGVMGAKNPLRRMTAYLFVFFVLLAVTINWYYHQGDSAALPVGVTLPERDVQTLEEPVPAPGVEVKAETGAEGALRPEATTEEKPAIRPEAPAGMPPPPVETGSAVTEPAKEEAAKPEAAADNAASSLRPETPAATAPAPVAPPAAAAEAPAK